MRTFLSRWILIVAIVTAGAGAGTTTAGLAAGALAIGQCGAYGQAIDHVRADQAASAALRACKGKCQVVAMQRACAALAVDLREPCGAYGHAIAPRISSALNEATRQCYRFGGKDCVIRAWACDGRG